MQSEPSRTAMLIATGRAAHLLLNGARAVLEDSMAWPLLGPYAETNLELAHEVFGEHWAEATTWMAARTRISEDWLTTSKAEQYMILGAGLDTFAWRQAGAIEVHEFDHPSTQGWKRERLEKLGVPEPQTLTMTEVNFEEHRVTEALQTSSVDLTRPIFVNWLGVLPYLTPAASPRPSLVSRHARRRSPMTLRGPPGTLTSAPPLSG